MTLEAQGELIGSGKLCIPMEKDALVADIESCLSRVRNGFLMVGVNVTSSNSFNLGVSNFMDNMDDLLCELMDKSLTCSIAYVNIVDVFDDQILFLTLIETHDSATNIDADVMDAISKLPFN